MMKRFIVGFLLLVLLFSTVLPAGAQEQPILKLDRVVQISDRELVFEFSEPVVINKLDPNSKGPFVGLRVVNKKGAVQHIGEDATLVYLQWKGALSYLDSKHDRLLWTISGQACGITTIPEIFSWKGELAAFRDTCEIRLVIEEIPLNKAASDLDGGVFNITTEDGSRNLFATHITGWESAQMPVVKQYGYEIDRSVIESIRLPLYEGDVLYNGAEIEETEEVPDPIPVKTQVRNHPLVIAAILGGAVMVGLAIILFAVQKKGGKA